MSTQENEKSAENIENGEENLIPEMIKPELTDNDLRCHFDNVAGMRINLKPEYVDAQEEYLNAEVFKLLFMKYIFNFDFIILYILN
jgi:hypothetical protein